MLCNIYAVLEYRMIEGFGDQKQKQKPIEISAQDRVSKKPTGLIF